VACEASSTSARHPTPRRYV